jgi:hypothetical protein
MVEEILGLTRELSKTQVINSSVIGTKYRELLTARSVPVQPTWQSSPDFVEFVEQLKGNKTVEYVEPPVDADPEDDFPEG